ncbi:MAG: hypothetical protein GEU73_04420 [Chloroflexi bacterium]|nr:hypothetical protein [Chloroflexota bacterium]
MLLYRIVVTNPPTADDFTASEVRGVPAPGDPELQRLHSGVSTYATEQQARRKALDYPWLGAYIATIDIPETGRIRWERTFPGSRGHNTVWGDPRDLLGLVVAVTGVGDVG